MAHLAAAIPAIIAGGAQIVGGIQRKEAAEYEAGEFERRAGETRATSQREAIEERRQSRLASSRAQAVSAASGAGAADPDVVKRIADIEAEGEYNFLREIWEGQSASDQDLRQADVTRKAGKRQLISSILSGLSGAGAEAARIHQAYKPGGPTTMLQKYGDDSQDPKNYG